ncbi:MAG TPA: penicillin-binding protein activator, partial [Anaerolineae bacterium]|nr:penicillin-binding protein activator [Anaerolineae bacterium]
MMRWAAGLLLVLSLLVLAAQCNLSGAAGGDSGPALPTPPSGPTLRIALLAPTTGELATFGRSLGNGSVLAFDEWNSRGGVLGRRIEWSIYEAPCDFEAASQAVQQAVADGFHFIIGPLCSDAAIAAAQVVDENAETTLMIAPAATHPSVTVDGQGRTRSTVFRASYAYPLQARAAAHFAVDTLHARRAALLVDPHDDYSTALADAFSTEFAAQGGQIVYRAPYAPTEPDFTQILQAIGQAGAEIIYMPAAASVVNR